MNIFRSGYHGDQVDSGEGGCTLSVITITDMAKTKEQFILKLPIFLAKTECIWEQKVTLILLDNKLFWVYKLAMHEER